MLVIKNKGKPATVRKLAEAIIRTGIVPEKKHNRLTTELRYLQLGPERFGEVDIHNTQQVMLVAYRVAKGNIARPAKGRQPKRRDPAVYELAIIGAGTTTAYYLDTLGPAYDHSATIVIGEENPWIRQRGQGISYINHTWRQIAMPSMNITKYGGNESFANRTEFGRAAEAMIAQHVSRWVKSTVHRIKKVNEVYHVSYGRDGLQSIKAKRVVFAAGSGTLRTPPELKDRSITNVDRIIEMNTFVRDKAKQETGRVVIWGSNAAIDAVAAAKVHGWTIAVWLYSTENQPAWLPGTRYLSPPYDLQYVTRHVYSGRNDIAIEDSGDQLRIRNKKNGALVADRVDYVVYGMGSEDLLTEGGKDKLMDDSVKEGARTLSPILDTEGVFGDPVDGGRQRPAFLGWQNGSGTFRVFGLSAENYAGVPAGDRFARIAPDDPRVMALKHWISGDVLSVGQLTYIRSALRAVNNYIPGSIEHGVDYSHADANNLRVHLATRYPELPEVYAAWFIGMLRRVRSDLQARLPHGFTTAQVTYIEQELELKEQLIVRGGTNTKIDAVNWQWNLSGELRRLTPERGEEVKTALRKLSLDQR